MRDLPVLARALFIVVVVVGSGLSLFFWVRALRQIANSDLDPEERKRWRRRVLMTRGIGMIQWEQFRRKRGVSSRSDRPEDEGLNSAPPPGSD